MHTQFRRALTARLLRFSCLACLAVATGALVSGCDRKAPAQPPLPSATTDTTTGTTTGATTGTSAGTSTSGITGVIPQSENSLPASDRPGAPATGAVEAGQAGSTGRAGMPVPTAGDGAQPASAAAPAASR